MVNTRNTKQRKTILEYLQSTHEHPNAEQVHKAVIKQLPKITLATVYRNLNLLANQGTILRLEVNKEYRYDACCSSHQHCVCVSCGCICDSHQDKISKYAMKNCDVKGFVPESVKVIFKGKCKKCAR